jgi:taurine dioxygenase
MIAWSRRSQQAFACLVALRASLSRWTRRQVLADSSVGLPAGRLVERGAAMNAPDLIEIEPLTPTIGAEVRGLDLRRALPPETVAAVRRALLDHLVLFFRDQPLTIDEHVRFAGYFGEIDRPPFRSPGADRPELTILDQTDPKGQGADSWHADYTHRAEPPMGSILRAVELPADGGGDTCFASMYAAYDDLSPALRGFVDGLHAVNTLQMMAERARERTPEVSLTDDATGGYPSFVHPVVRVHPETGRKLLNVNANWTSRITELTDTESRALLDLLLHHLRSPDYQCRFRWQPHSIAFWDNRAVQHFAVADYHQRRVMHRITLAGDRPRGTEAMLAGAVAGSVS